MVTNKSEQQVKNFYHNYKKKHNLDQLIIESKKKKPAVGTLLQIVVVMFNCHCGYSPVFVLTFFLSLS